MTYTVAREMSPELAFILSLSPPWLVATVLLGFAHGSLFFLLAGKCPRSLPAYWVLGVAAAIAGQMVGFQLDPPPPPLALGEVHLPAASAGAWVALAIARMLGV